MIPPLVPKRRRRTTPAPPPPAPPAYREVLTIPQTADFLGVSESTVYRALRAGLPRRKVGARTVLLKREVLAWVKAAAPLGRGAGPAGEAGR